MAIENYGAKSKNHGINIGIAIEDGRRNEACTVMLWSHFLESPSLLHPDFESGYSPARNYPGILDFTMGLDNEWLTMFEVFTNDDFVRASNDLQTRCLLFRTHIKHDRVCRVSEKHFNTERWTDELAVLINTDHPKLRDNLQLVLEQAKTDMESGKKFCLRLDFGQGLKEWFGVVCESSRINVYPKSYDTDKVKNISVYILNCSKPVAFYMSKWAIICCFPCWLVTGGCCYYTNRKKTVDDIVKKFSYQVTFEARGAREQEDTPFCGCGKIYHLPVLNLQMLQGTYGAGFGREYDDRWSGGIDDRSWEDNDHRSRDNYEMPMGGNQYRLEESYGDISRTSKDTRSSPKDEYDESNRGYGEMQRGTYATTIMGSGGDRDRRYPDENVGAHDGHAADRPGYSRERGNGYRDKRHRGLGSGRRDFSGDRDNAYRDDRRGTYATDSRGYRSEREDDYRDKRRGGLDSDSRDFSGDRDSAYRDERRGAYATDSRGYSREHDNTSTLV